MQSKNKGNLGVQFLKCLTVHMNIQIAVWKDVLTRNLKFSNRYCTLFQLNSQNSRISHLEIILDTFEHLAITDL